MSNAAFTPISGPAVAELDLLKDSQGQPPSTGDITQDRILAVARALNRSIEVQNYLLNRVRITGDVPHREHQHLYQMRDELAKAKQTLDVFFFGD